MSSSDVRGMVDAAVDAALTRLRPQLVDAVVASLPPPPPPVVVPAPVAGPAGPSIDAKALRRSLFGLMDGTGQVEILNSLMGTITAHWDRAVLFLVQSSFKPWEARGFEAGIGNDAAKGVVIGLEDDTILAAALSGTGAQSANHLLDRLGPAHGLRAAVPLAIRNKAAAILYVDGPKGDHDVAVAAMEILARVTAGSIELGMLMKKAPPFVRCEAVVAPAAAAPAPPPQAAAPAPAAADFAWSAPAVAEPEMDMEVEVEAEPAAPPPAPTPTFAAPPAAPPPEPRPAAPAPTPSFAAPPPAAPPPAAVAPPRPAAPPAAAAPSEPEAGGTLDPRDLLKGGAKPVVDAGQSLGDTKVASRWKPVREQMKTGEAVDPAMAAIPEAERGKHVEARKIARLLVSEIKLYNEAKVAVGRKNRDLYERLKEDIERSRQTYLQRIDPDVASKSNYFQDELVATLAEGDAGALGAGR